MTVRTNTLSNGLRIVTDDMPGVETASLGVWVGVGTRHEPREVNGVAHLLEHMAFKGTKRRSALQIAQEIEAVGGHLNAYTSREQTAYYAKVLKEDVGLGIDMLADILQHSVFDESELQRERAVVLQEIGQAYDTPDDIIFDYFQTAAFPNQALGRPVLGSAEIVSSLSRDAIRGYMSGHYGARNMVLAAAGKLDHAHVAELAARAFDALPAERSAATDIAHYTGGEQREERDLEQAHIVLGFEGIPYDDPDYYALAVFSTLFGGGMSSRLFQEVREKRGLVYSIYSFSASYRDGGLFGVYAGTGEKEVRELIPVVCEEFRRALDKIDAEEINRARAQLKASLLMSLESTGARSEQIANHLLIYGRVLTTDELVRRVEAVDEAAVRRVVKRLLASRPALAAVGPLSQLEPLDAIATRLA
ncbi:MAG: insulinase family protein [Alphaproteobacteria bacterium]|nr:insulinase family protein [Alphaproteobacteria bacterium]